MLMQIGIIFGSAFLSSALTLTIVYIIFHSSWKKQLYADMDEYADIIKQKLKEGAIEAGAELLPDFRQQVREGFKEAMTDSLKGELIERSARDMARSGTDLMETGLNLLLGKNPPKKEDDPGKRP